MSGYASEEKLLENAAKHAAEFRRKHRVTQSEWDLAVAMTADLGAKLLAEFWEVYNRERNDGRRNSRALPRTGVEDEVRSADGPSQKGKSPRLRKVRDRRPKHGN